MSMEKTGKKIDYDKYEFSFKEKIRYTSVGAGLGILICWLCYHSIYSAPLAVFVAVISAKEKEDADRKTKNDSFVSF